MNMPLHICPQTYLYVRTCICICTPLSLSFSFLFLSCSLAHALSLSLSPTLPSLLYIYVYTDVYERICSISSLVYSYSKIHIPCFCNFSLISAKSPLSVDLSRECSTLNEVQSLVSRSWLSGLVYLGALILTYTILGVPYYNYYSIMGPQTLF